jgi:hypothetical protein
VSADELPCAISSGALAGGHGQTRQVASQILREGFDRRVAAGRRLAQRLEHDRVQVRVRAGRLRLFLAYGLPQLQRCTGADAVGAAAGEQLVQDDAQRVDVRSGRQGLAPELLRAGIGRCHRPELGDRGRRDRIDELRHAEVQQLGHVAGGDEDVGRLEVAVDDQVLVGVLDRRAHRAEQLHPRPHG